MGLHDGNDGVLGSRHAAYLFPSLSLGSCLARIRVVELRGLEEGLDA